MQSIHAHTVLDWIAGHDRGVRADQVIAWSEVALGDDAQFHTCERAGMGIRQLLEYFVMAGKVQVIGNRICLESSRMCTHR